MKPTDWVKKYAAMDKRVELKYLHLPKGEQIGVLQRQSRK